MNTTSLIAAFVVVVSALIWAGTHSNNADWTGNRNQCVGECYEDWKARMAAASQMSRRRNNSR